MYVAGAVRDAYSSGEYRWNIFSGPRAGIIYIGSEIYQSWSSGGRRNCFHAAWRADVDSIAAHVGWRKFGGGAGCHVPFAVLTIFLMRLVIKSRGWKQTTGREQLIGEEGEAMQEFGGAKTQGEVRVHGELWSAVSQQAITKGARVRVFSVDGLTLHVELAGPV